jgi:hypothetical protein
MFEQVSEITKIPADLLRKLNRLLLNGDVVTPEQQAFLLRLAAYMLQMNFSLEKVLLFIQPFLKPLLEYADLINTPDSVNGMSALQILDNRYVMLVPPREPGELKLFDTETAEWVSGSADIPHVGIIIYLWHAAKFGQMIAANLISSL